jgi:hypothetical protein
MYIVLIRRFVRLDREPEFLARFRDQKPPNDNAAFLGETLTKVSDDASLPPRLRSFALNGASCATYLNIARWDSREAFEQHFLGAGSSDFDPELETSPRQRMLLDVVSG